MYVSDDTARLCPKVAGLLNSDSHLKMFVIYRLAELKMNELGFDIPVGDKEAVNHLARFLKADVSVQAVISPKAAGTSPAPGKTKKNIKKRNKDKATPISKAKEKTGPYGNGDNKDTEYVTPDPYRDDTAPAVTDYPGGGSEGGGFSDRDLMSREEYDYLTEVG